MVEAKKKILYIHHGKGLGGAPLSLLYLIKELDPSRYHPMVLFLHDSDALELFRAHAIEIFGPLNRYDFPHTQIWWFRWYHVVPFLRSLRDTIAIIYSIAHYWLDLIKPDIVHLNTSSLGAWAYVAHKKNIPIVWHIREPLAQGYFGIRKKIIIQLIKKYAHTIVPICKDNARPWLHDKKTNIVYNAVPQSSFFPAVSYDSFLKKYGLKKETPKILFVGGLSQEKGTLELFTLFQKLLAFVSDAQLLVAGYFAFHKRRSFIKQFFPASCYEKKVQQVLITIQNRLVFLGSINTIPEAMAASDVVVFPATVGHFARPVIEAGFMQKPVIASPYPPLDELVLHNKTGFLIDPQDQAAWVEKLSLLLQDKEYNKKMGCEAYDFCIRHFNTHEYGKKIEKIYSSIR